MNVVNVTLATIIAALALWVGFLQYRIAALEEGRRKGQRVEVVQHLGTDQYHVTLYTTQDGMQCAVKYPPMDEAEFQKTHKEVLRKIALAP